jgi:hypothetical protein
METISESTMGSGQLANILLTRGVRFGFSFPGTHKKLSLKDNKSVCELSFISKKVDKNGFSFPGNRNPGTPTIDEIRVSHPSMV